MLHHVSYPWMCFSETFENFSINCKKTVRHFQIFYNMEQHFDKEYLWKNYTSGIMLRIMTIILIPFSYSTVFQIQK